MTKTTTLVIYSDHNGAQKLAGLLVERLQRANRPAVLRPYADEALCDGLDAAPDLVVTVGGDGTLLRTVARCPEGAAFLGVNMGNLGYLAAAHARTVEDAYAHVMRALQGEIEPQARMRLRATLVGEGVRSVRVVLNDVTLDNARTSLITFELRADGKFVTEYRSDGLIIATPTGSTAYNLAAGGPILMPGVQAIAVTAICPHNLSNRPVVVDPGTVLTVAPSGRSRGQRAALAFDGQRTECAGDWELRVEAGPPARIYHGADPFEVLRTRLHWC